MNVRFTAPRLPLRLLLPIASEEIHMENIITKIEKLDPHPTEAIVVSWNFNDIDVDNMQNLFHVVQSKFPDNIVVAIPDYISLQSCSKDVLENIISMIAEIIEEL